LPSVSDAGALGAGGAGGVGQEPWHWASAVSTGDNSKPVTSNKACGDKKIDFGECGLPALMELPAGFRFFNGFDFLTIARLCPQDTPAAC
jgi:hypothetical protein